MIKFSCYQNVNEQRFSVKLKRKIPLDRSVVIRNAPVVNSLIKKGEVTLPCSIIRRLKMRNRYRLSRWCMYFEREDIMAFWHSINFALVFLPKPIGQKLISSNFDLKEIEDDLFGKLQKENLIVNCDYDEMQELVKVRERFLENKNLEIMYLLLTDFCNLKCKYCFEETPLLVSSPVPMTNMDISTVNRSIDLFADLTTKYGRKEYKRIIHFYGGEPLINIPAIKAAISRVDELKQIGRMPQECEVAIVTNGVLLSEEIIKFFAEHEVTVGISIDGPEEINNMYRIPKKNIDMFSIISRNYKLLQKYHVKNGISATLTPEVVDNFDKVLSFFIDKLGIQDGISFNIMHYNPGISLSDDYFKKTAQCLISAFKRFREIGIYEERIMRKAKAFIDRQPMFSDCGATGNQIVVAPDGLIGMCQDFVKPRTYFDYSVFDDNFDPYEFNLFKEWKYRSPLFMKQCQACEALGICGGGCPASAELKTGSMWNIDDRICSHSKKTLEWLIWDAFSETNNS